MGGAQRTQLNGLARSGPARQPGQGPLSGKADISARRLEGEILTDAVEKVGYEAAATFLGIFSRGRCAIRNRPSASESRLSEVSYGSRYPLVSTICNRA